MNSYKSRLNETRSKMNPYSLPALLAGLLLLMLPTLSARAQPADSTLVLDELVRQVLEENPELRSSREGWNAGKTRIPQEEALPDPTLGLSLMNLPVNSFALDQEPMTGKQVTLMQPIPFPGKLRLKGDIARSESEVTFQQHRELQNQLVKRAKQAYYDLYYTDRALETVARNRELLNEFVEIAETRYSVGNGLQQDVMRAQVALSKMIDRELRLRQERISIQARLNRLINEPAGAPLGKATAPAAGPLSLPLDSLVQRARGASPLLAAWNTVLKRSGQQVDLALRDRYPDFSVGLAYTQRNDLQNGMRGYDFLSAMVNIRLPLYHGKKQDQKVQQQRLNRSSVEYRYQNVEQTLEQQLQQSLTEAQKNRRLIALYETGIIPQAEESLESSLAGYQNGQVDFLSLLDSELTLFQFRLDHHRFLADYHKAVAELEALTGTDL